MKHQVNKLNNKQLVDHLRNESTFYKRKNLINLLLECANRIEFLKDGNCLSCGDYNFCENCKYF